MLLEEAEAADGGNTNYYSNEQHFNRKDENGDEGVPGRAVFS